MRIGLFFGSFDPVHIGHIALATFVLNSKLVDKILMVPAFHNPWKSNKPVNFESRLSMCHYATYSIDNIEISSIEEELSKDNEPVNTYNTIEALKKQFPNDELIILMSNETFNEVKDWYMGEEIIHNNEFILVSRNDATTNWRQLAGTKCNRVLKKFPRIDVSSTMIRNYIEDGLEIVPWVPIDVAKYIKQKELYK